MGTVEGELAVAKQCGWLLCSWASCVLVCSLHSTRAWAKRSGTSGWIASAKVRGQVQLQVLLQRSRAFEQWMSAMHSQATHQYQLRTLIAMCPRYRKNGRKHRHLAAFVTFDSYWKLLWGTVPRFLISAPLDVWGLFLRSIRAFKMLTM